MTSNNKNRDPLEILGRARGFSKNEIENYLPRHANFSPYLLWQLGRLSEAELRYSGSILAKKVIKMMREISKEAYRAKQFTRTEINDHGVLFGVVSIKHKVMDNVLHYFHERWPQGVVCLFNNLSQKTFMISEKGNIMEYDLPLDEVVSRISKNRSKSPYFSDIQFSNKEIFETLYKSQHISERENARYFKNMIPEHCFRLPGMKKGVERLFTPGNKKIDDYF
ncbi:MAG: DUF4130 domain-containing protein [Candidatus Lokiarchaeota archaeon]|nr:DUF4130 domain-containing protein [Candidatus Lokiarchaeota archaeon]